MGLVNYTPNNAFPDLDGSGGNGPLQMPSDNDPVTYEVVFIGSGGTANKHGLFGKILDGLYYLWKRTVKDPTAWRVLTPAPIFDIAVWAIGAVYGKLSAVSTGGTAYFYLPIPHGAVLSTIEVTVKPNTGHGALPATMPSITWTALDITTNAAVASTGATQSDTSGSVVAYEALHTITLSGGGANMPYTHDATKVRVGLAITNESGANALSSLSIVGIRAKWTD